MANWSSNTIKLGGAGAAEVVAFINARHEPIAHPTTNDPWMAYVDIAPLIPELPQDLRGGLNFYHKDLPLTLDETGATRFWCETKWHPPIDALERLTRKHPGLIATIIWSIELEYVPRGVRIVNGETTVDRDGDFVLAEKGEPIHHWMVEAATPEAMAAIKAAQVRVLVPPSRWWHKRESFRHLRPLRLRDSQIDKVRSIPGVHCSPFTLDEQTFLSGLNPNIYPTGVGPIEAARWVRLCERRQVMLTPEEIEAVRQKAEAAAKMPGDLSFHEADRHHFHPTAQEIEWLLPLATDERQKELQAALDKPEWTTTWPEWNECEVDSDSYHPTALCLDCGGDKVRHNGICADCGSDNFQVG